MSENISNNISLIKIKFNRKYNANVRISNVLIIVPFAAYSFNAETLSLLFK